LSQTFKTQMASDDEKEQEAASLASDEKPCEEEMTFGLSLLRFYIPGAILMFAHSLTIPLIPSFLATELGEDPAWTGVAVSMAGLGGMMLSVPAGIATARLGEKNTMMATLVVYSVSAGLAAFSPTLWVFLPLKLINGGSLEALRVARQTYIAKIVPVHIRGKVMSNLGGTNRVGTCLGPLVGGFIASYTSFRLAFFFSGLVSILALLMTSIFIPNEDQEAGGSSATPRSDRPARVGMCRVCSDYWVLIATAGTFSHMIQVLRESRSVILPLQAEAMELSTKQMGYVISAGFFVDSVTFPLAGLLMDRCGRKWAGVPANLVMAVGFAVLACVTDNIGLLTAASVIIGLGNGLSSGVNLTLGADLAPLGCRGEFIGVYRLVTNSGSFLGPVVVGAVVIHNSTGMAAWGLTLAGLATALWMMLMIKETLRGKAEDETAEEGQDDPGGRHREGNLSIAAFVPLQDSHQLVQEAMNEPDEDIIAVRCRDLEEGFTE